MEWFKRICRAKVEAEEGKAWYPVFHRVRHSSYEFYAHESKTWEAFEEIKTTNRFVILDGVKHYECSQNQWFNEKDLMWPT